MALQEKIQRLSYIEWYKFKERKRFKREIAKLAEPNNPFNTTRNV